MDYPLGLQVSQLSRMVGGANDHLTGGLPPNLESQFKTSWFQQLTGRDAVTAAINELANDARKSMDTVLPYRPSLEAARASYAADRNLVLRGVRMRIISATVDGNDPAEIEHTKNLQRIGVQRKVLPDVNVRLVIVDNEAALISSQPHVGFADAPVILTRNVGTVLIISSLFEQYWRQAMSHDHALRHRSRDPLTPLQENLIGDVIAGLTSTAIAKKNNLSLRTTERMLDDLNKHFGTTNRVTLTAEAVRLGWGFGAKPRLT